LGLTLTRNSVKISIYVGGQSSFTNWFLKIELELNHFARSSMICSPDKYLSYRGLFASIFQSLVYSYRISPCGSYAPTKQLLSTKMKIDVALSDQFL